MIPFVFTRARWQLPLLVQLALLPLAARHAHAQSDDMSRRLYRSFRCDGDTPARNENECQRLARELGIARTSRTGSGSPTRAPSGGLLGGLLSRPSPPPPPPDPVEPEPEPPAPPPPPPSGSQFGRLPRVAPTDPAPRRESEPPAPPRNTGHASYLHESRYESDGKGGAIFNVYLINDGQVPLRCTAEVQGLVYAAVAIRTENYSDRRSIVIYPGQRRIAAGFDRAVPNSGRYNTSCVRNE